MPKPQQTTVKHSTAYRRALTGNKASKTRKLAGQNRPISKSELEVESLFERHIEFESKEELQMHLQGTMSPKVLDTVLAKLLTQNKVMHNDDGTFTWIDITNNETLKKSWANAIKL